MKAKCAAPGCDQPHHAKGWCMTHYYRLKRGMWDALSRPIARYAKRGAQAVCSVDGCDKPYHAKGYCSAHYSAHYYAENAEAIRVKQKGHRLRRKREGIVKRFGNGKGGKPMSQQDKLGIKVFPGTDDWTVAHDLGRDYGEKNAAYMYGQELAKQVPRTFDMESVIAGFRQGFANRQPPAPKAPAPART